MTGNYAIVDDAGNVLNVAVWDGSAPWVTDGTKVLVPDGAPAEPGGTYVPDADVQDRWVRAPSDGG
jgi:hypothetical protein